MHTESIHEFHFVMGREMKKKLTNLNLFKKTKGLSGTIIKILKFLTPLIRYEHKWGKQRLSRYMNICNDPDEIREHVHAYFPGEMYRELKLIHQDLNIYSIAQLIRGFLDFFIELFERFKEKAILMLKRIFKQWREEDKEMQLTPQELLVQLWKIIQHLPGENKLINIYSRSFSPFWVLRI